MNNQSFTLFKNIYNQISIRNKKKSSFIIFLIFLCTFLEFLAISLIPIIVMAITNNIGDDYIFFFKVLNYSNQENLIKILSLILITVFSIRLFLNIIYLNKLTSFLMDIKIYFTEKLIKSIFSMDYLSFQKKEVSSTTRLLIDEKNILISNFATSCFAIIMEFVTLVPYIIICVYVDYKVFLLLSIFFIFIFFILKITLIKKIKYWGSQRLKLDSLQHKKIQELILSSKNIYLDNLLLKFLKNIIFYTKAGANYERLNIFYQMIPRYFLEFLIIFLLFFFTYFISTNSNYLHMLPVLATYLVMSLKLMPSLNRILQAVQSIKYSEPVVNSILNSLKYYENKSYLNESILKNRDSKIKITKNLEINNVNFGYVKSKKILTIDKIKFNCGDIVYISGQSGSGKTTFIEILSGLIKDQTKIIVDNKILSTQEDYKNFQKNISYVPQNNYLIDDTIKENILFSNEDPYIFYENYNKILEMCILDEFVKTKETNFTIGEFGSKLSGGQKQRISLARCLLKDAEILILDEATNALDQELEIKIINNIFNSQKYKIIFLISHNKELKKFCNKNITIENGLAYNN